VYVLAVVCPRGTVGVAMIFMGRLITGMGVAGRTLAYSYVATAVPFDQQRTTLTIMSMTRTFGMLLGPLLNLLVARVDSELILSRHLGWRVPVNPNNAPGLIVAASEVALLVATYFFLVDPPSSSGKSGTRRGSGPPVRAGLGDIWNAATHFDLALPMANMFVVMFSFTFYSVAIPPVASHAFGWEPFAISNVLALQAVVLFIGMVASMWFSMKSAKDISLITFGNFAFVVGGAATYLLWRTDGSTAQFILPILIVSLSYPFIGPANRSKFTKAVHNRPELENAHGIMQSLFNQGFMLGGFISPNFTAAYMLRSSENIEESGSPYELTLWTWIIPISSILMIIGLLYEEFAIGKNELGWMNVDEKVIGESQPGEMSHLLPVNKRRSSIVSIEQSLSRQFEVDRRYSVEANGICNPFETSEEVKFRNQLIKDKNEWDKLSSSPEES